MALCCPVYLTLSSFFVVYSCPTENAKTLCVTRYKHDVQILLRPQRVPHRKPACDLLTYTKVQQVCIAKDGDRKYVRNFSWGSQMNEELLNYSCTWNSLVVLWNKQLLFFRMSFNWLFVLIEKRNASSRVAVIISSNILINLIFHWFILRGN